MVKEATATAAGNVPPLAVRGAVSIMSIAYSFLCFRPSNHRHLLYPAAEYAFRAKQTQCVISQVLKCVVPAKEPIPLNPQALFEPKTGS